MKTQLLKNFKNPPNEYRGKPFWSWNGELEKNELIRQIDCFEEMGFGGYFMHSRVGLETEYLGEKWFELINSCSDYGYSKGLESYLYDEDRWPSGTAGGMVTKNPEYREKYIEANIFDVSSFSWKHNYIAAFRLDLTEIDDIPSGFKYTWCVPVTPKSTPTGEGKIVAFKIVEMAKDNFYNGYTYVDTMNKNATHAYIKSTHEKYVEKCGDRIGTKIKAIFTDEPHRGPVFTPFSGGGKNRVPYTDKLFDEYANRFSENLMDKLPELFFCKDGEALSPVKWQFVELLQQLFLEGFIRPINNWCEKHNIELTGHALHEDSLSCQLAMAGSMMRIYPHMGAPGIDVLGGSNYSYWIVKQLASAARQSGKKILLSELYGGSNWEFDFEGHKAMGDWQSLFGINLRCPHLSWYTMKGEGKRDYPASISFQSAWYKDYKYVEDYFSRMHVLLSAGKPQCELLVINPIESMWARVRMNMYSTAFNPVDPHCEKLEEIYVDTFNALAGNRIDFDYGDEGLMAELASVTATGVLKVGKCSYKKVLISGVDTIRSSTLRLLEKFVKLGGEVVFAGDIPSYVDSIPSDKVSLFAKNCTCIPLSQIPKSCASGKEITVENSNAPTLFSQTRVDGNDRYCVIINVGREKSYGTLTLCLGEGSNVCELDLRTGETVAVDFKVKEGKVYVDTDFPIAREHAYVVNNSSAVKKITPKVTEKEITLPEEYSYTLSEKNLYVMDYVSFSINGSRMSSPREILTADRMLRKKLGLANRGGNMQQPWFIKSFCSDNIKPLADVTLRYNFHIKNKPKTQMELVVEDGKKYEIYINGNPIDTTSSTGKWIDSCYDKFIVPTAYIHSGKNEVLLKSAYTALSNTESIFLLGDFGVDMINGEKPVITKLPKKLHIGDISLQGLPFYTGNLIYKTEIKELKGKKAEIFLGGYEGALSKITVGKKSVMTAWKPLSADITPLVSRSGKLSIEVCMTRHNAYGSMAGGLHPAAEAGVPGKYTLVSQGLTEKPIIKIYK